MSGNGNRCVNNKQREEFEFELWLVVVVAPRIIVSPQVQFRTLDLGHGPDLDWIWYLGHGLRLENGIYIVSM